MPEEGAATAKLKKATTAMMAIKRIHFQTEETAHRLETEVDAIYEKYHK